MSELEAKSPPPQQAQPDLGPRKDGAPGATNKALHDQRYYKDRVCDAPRKLATVAPPKKIGGAPRPKKRLDPKLGDLDSYRVVACDAPGNVWSKRGKKSGWSSLPYVFCYFW